MNKHRRVISTTVWRGAQGYDMLKLAWPTADGVLENSNIGIFSLTSGSCRRQLPPFFVFVRFGPNTSTVMFLLFSFFSLKPNTLHPTITHNVQLFPNQACLWGSYCFFRNRLGLVGWPVPPTGATGSPGSGSLVPPRQVF